MTLDEYQDEKIEILERQLSLALKHRKIDEVNYRRLCGEIEKRHEWDAMFDNIGRLFTDFRESMLKHVAFRIAQNAEHIETLEPNDPKLPGMMHQYDKLCEELRRG